MRSLKIFLLGHYQLKQEILKFLNDHEMLGIFYITHSFLRYCIHHIVIDRTVFYGPATL